MPWPPRVVAIDAFYMSLDTLERSQEIVRVGTRLMLDAVRYPRNTAPLEGLRVRVLESTLGGHPALRLFYSFDGTTVRLLRLEPYDELL